MNAQALADIALSNRTIQKQHLAMLRSVWKTNERRGGASRERLMLGLVPAIELAARLATLSRLVETGQKLGALHWSEFCPAQMRADAAVLLTDMCIAKWGKVS